MRGRVGLALFAALVLTAGLAVAQQTTLEIKNGQVLKVEGNTLIVRTAEGVKSVEVPDDFRFDMNGKKLAVQELKPGMMLTAFITTKEKPGSTSAPKTKRTPTSV